LLITISEFFHADGSVLRCHANKNLNKNGRPATQCKQYPHVGLTDVSSGSILKRLFIICLRSLTIYTQLRW